MFAWFLTMTCGVVFASITRVHAFQAWVRRVAQNMAVSVEGVSLFLNEFQRCSRTVICLRGTANKWNCNGRCCCSRCIFRWELLKLLLSGGHLSLFATMAAVREETPLVEPTAALVMVKYEFRGNTLSAGRDAPLKPFLPPILRQSEIQSSTVGVHPLPSVALTVIRTFFIRS